MTSQKNVGPPVIFDSTDDWSGITDPKERRKRQNRLHQRAWRRRKAEAAPRQHTTSTRKLISPVIPYLSHAREAAGPFAPIIFPLSPDHRLLILIQYNVLRAVISNMTVLGVLDRLPLECRGALQIAPIRIVSANPGSDTAMPPKLRPTPLQCIVPHEPYIDILPCPTMRDNMILQAAAIDHDALCEDVLGGLYEGYDDCDSRGVLVWGDPWVEEAWEVTEGFTRKWGSLLKGCAVLMESTNRRREARGEDRLVIEI